MVRHVSRPDIELKSVNKLRVVSINSSESSLQPGPGVVIVQLNSLISVMQPGNKNEPRIDYQIGSAVDSKDVGKTSMLGPNIEEVEEGDNSNIRQHNLGNFISREELIGNKHVRGEPPSVPVRDSNQKIERKPKEQKYEYLENSERLNANDFSHLVVGFSVLRSLDKRDMRLALRDVAVLGVVNKVTPLPRKIGDEN